MSGIGASRPAHAGGEKRAIENLVEALSGLDEEKLARVWPLHGKAAEPYDERIYQESCRAEVVETSIVCRREDFFQCSDEDFVAAAFKVFVGHAPDRSVWHYHVNQLRSGEASRDDILRIVQDSPAARARNVVVFEHGHLRWFMDYTGVGLRQIALVLLGLARSRIWRRLGLLVRRLRPTGRD